jgi:hypothetical protein
MSVAAEKIEIGLEGDLFTQYHTANHGRHLGCDRLQRHHITPNVFALRTNTS